MELTWLQTFFASVLWTLGHVFLTTPFEKVTVFVSQCIFVSATITYDEPIV